MIRYSFSGFQGVLLFGILVLLSGFACAQGNPFQDQLFLFSIEWQSPVTDSNRDLDRMIDSSGMIDAKDLLLLLGDSRYDRATPTPTATSTPSPTFTPYPYITPFFDHNGEWPSVAAVSNGDYVLSYEDNDRVHIRFFDEEGEEQAEEIDLEIDSGRPHLVVDNKKWAWLVYEYGDDDIRLFQEQKPNRAYQVFTNRQKRPALAVNSDRQAIIAWEDHRQDTLVLVRKASYVESSDPAVDGVVFSPSAFLVSDDADDQKDPDVAANDRDDFLVVWVRYSKGIKGNLLDWNDTPSVDDEFRISENADAPKKPRVAALGENFLVVWEDEIEGKDMIFGRLVNRSGDPLGTAEFRVDDSPGTAVRPAVAASGVADLYLVVWDDDRQGGGSIYGRVLNSSGQPQGPSFPLTPPGDAMDRISLAFNLYSGNPTDYILTWRREGDDCEASLHTLGE